MEGYTFEDLIPELFKLSYHPKLKIFGSFFDIMEVCTREGREKGWIKDYNGDINASYSSEFLKMCGEIKEINEKDIESLIKQGYQKI